MQKKALITGITGQIGEFLARNLISKGYRVSGLARTEKLPSNFPKEIEFYSGDVSNLEFLEKILSEVNPDEIYNLAAVSNARTSMEIPEETFYTNALPVISICEYARKKNPSMKIFQASSAELFGPISGMVNEETKFNPQNPYAIAKLAAHEYVNYARKRYGLFACNGILFNTESIRRPESFVTRKITSSVAKIKLDKLKSFSLWNLDSRRDWIHISDVISAIEIIMAQDSSDNYIISSGKSHSVEDFVSASFESISFPISWGGSGKTREGRDPQGVLRIHIEQDHFLEDNRESFGDNSKLKALGWVPKISFKELVKEMVENDVKSLEN